MVSVERHGWIGADEIQQLDDDPDLVVYSFPERAKVARSC